MRFGFACERNGKIAASLAGGNVVEYSGWRALPDDAWWVTEHTHGAYVANGNVTIDYIKHSAFFTVSHREIAGEIGHHDLRDDACIRHLAEIFSRCASLSCSRSGIPEPAIEANMHGARAFSEVLISAMEHKHPGVTIDSATRSALFKARSMPGGGQFSAELQLYAAIQPRYLNLDEIENLTLPSGRFDEIDILLEYDETVEWLKFNRPALCRVRVVSPGLALAATLPKHYLHGHEFWVAHPELVVLLSLGVVEVTRCFLATEHIPLRSVIGNLPAKPDLVDIISVSSGLMAECLLDALCSPALASKEKPDVNLVRSTWVASALRAKNLLLAARLAGFGLRIHEVTSSGVYFLAKPGDIDRLNEVSAQLGVVTCPA